MDHFSHRAGTLHAEEVAIECIADAVGTPFYCYSAATLRLHAAVFAEALAAIDPLICFAVKANSNLAVLALLNQCGYGADVVSEGELRRARMAGIPANRIVFSGVGKTAAEMRYALKQKIFQFNVESDRELLTLNDIAKELGVYAPVALRINPDVDAATHAKISTGKKENKFGIAYDMALPVYKLAESLPNILVQGISVHIGSQLTTLAPFRAAYTRIKAMVAELKAARIPLQTIDLGGGLGVPYEKGDIPPLPRDYGAMVSELFADFPGQIILEPGRLIAGNAGILVSRILYLKRAEKNYAILDAGMNDLMRPALYDAQHALMPIAETGATTLVDVVGPVCESSDVFARDVALADAREGALVAFRTAGAYGASMSNTYNSRLLIPEVLVDGKNFAVIRARPSYDAMLAAETIPDWL